MIVAAASIRHVVVAYSRWWGPLGLAEAGSFADAACHEVAAWVALHEQFPKKSSAGGDVYLRAQDADRKGKIY